MKPFIIFASMLCYLVWRLLFTLPFHAGIPSFCLGIAVWLCEVFAAAQVLTRFHQAQKAILPDMPDIPYEVYPDIDVLIVIQEEPAELIFKTINSCNYLKYPDKSKVRIHLCDGQDNPQMRALARKMGVYYHGFPARSKAEMLNFTLQHINAPLLAILDADMIPTEQFLMETVPYFFLDQMTKQNEKWRLLTEKEMRATKKIAYVQTHQSFYQPDLLQRNLHLENYVPGGYDIITRGRNLSRNATQTAIFTGSNAVFSRAAIHEMNGFASHCVAMSVSLLEKGYACIALDKELAHGRLPNTVQGEIKQTRRLYQDLAQTVCTKCFLTGGLPLSVKWDLILSYFHRWTFLGKLLCLVYPIILGLFGVTATEINIYKLFITCTIYYLLYSLVITNTTKGITNAGWNHVVSTIQLPYFIGKLKSKEKPMKNTARLRQGWMHLILLMLSTLAAVSCLYDITQQAWHMLPILLWLCHQIVVLLIALVYYTGIAKTQHYSNASISVLLQIGEKQISAKTLRMADNAIEIYLQNAAQLLFYKTITIAIFDKENYANLSVKDINLLSDNTCQLFLSPLAKYDSEEYLQIIYNRPHAFARKIKRGILRQIFQGYWTEKKQQTQKRRGMQHVVRLRTAEKGKLLFACCKNQLIPIEKSGNMPDQLTVFLSQNRLGRLVRTKQTEVVNGKQRNIYTCDPFVL